MGTSTSVITLSSTFASLKSDDPVAEETLEELLKVSLEDADLIQALPLEAIREVRHEHTKNFAQVLHFLIREVAAMAAKRSEMCAEGSTPLFPPAVGRFVSTLQLLRRLMPVALESGDTVLDKERGAPLSREIHHPEINLSGSDNDNSSEPRQQQPPQEEEEEQEEERMQEGAEGPEPTADEQEALQQADATEAGTVAAGEAPPPDSHDDAPVPAPAAPVRRTECTKDFTHLFFVRNSKCDDQNVEETFEPLAQQKDAEGKTIPLGRFLVWSLVECCFINSLTMFYSTNVESFSLAHDDVRADLLWSQGVGSENPFGEPPPRRESQQMFKVRKELLKTLLSVISSPVFKPAGARDTVFTEELITVASVPLMPTLAASLLNMLLNYEPYGVLPYSSYASGEAEGAVLAGTRLLCAVLCYIGVPTEAAVNTRPETESGPADSASASPAAATAVPPGNGSGEASTQPEGGAGKEETEQAGEGEQEGVSEKKEEEEEESKGEAEPEAAFGQSADRPNTGDNENDTNNTNSDNNNSHLKGRRHLVHSVRRMVVQLTLSEAKFIAERLIKVVGLNTYAKQTYLPDSQSSFPSQDEFVMLLWKLIDLSPAMVVSLSNFPIVLKYLVPLMNYAMDARKNPRCWHQLQATLFILLRLSEEKSFGKICNQPFTDVVPFTFPKMPSLSSYNDFLFTSLCLFLESRDIAMVSLFASCSVVLVNLSPYTTALNPVTSSKLVYIFALAAHRFLKALATSNSPSVAVLAHQSVMLNTCESIASLLQYHEGGSKYVLASLLDYRTIIQRVDDRFSLRKGPQELAVHTTIPLLIDTLSAAVGACLPLLASTDMTVNADDQHLQSADNAGALPPIERGAAQNKVFMEKLSTFSLVGVLPTRHPVIVRRFTSSKPIEQWATTSLWTSMYLHSLYGSLGDSASLKLLNFA